MGWPSVYIWGWIMVPGRFLIFVGALVIAAFAQSMSPRDVFPWVFAASFLALAAVSLVLMACPRCGRNVYRRSVWRSHSLWPVSTCTRCGLDLKKYAPLDRRAKA